MTCHSHFMEKSSFLKTGCRISLSSVKTVYISVILREPIKMISQMKSIMRSILLEENQN